MSNQPQNRSSLRAMIAMVALLFASSMAMAADEINTDRTGLAIGGYDPVSYFTSDKPMKGDFMITAEHEGAVYRFVSEQNKKTFMDNPTAYAPQFGGYCAYGVALNAKLSADPTVWQIADGKLYLNLNPAIAAEFNKDLQGHLKTANQNWQTLQSKAAR